MRYLDTHKADKSKLWVVYSNQINPAITSTMARYFYSSKDLAQHWTRLVSDNTSKWQYMKLSAGQSKVIEALYK